MVVLDFSYVYHMGSISFATDAGISNGCNRFDHMTELLTEEQAMKLTKALADRFRARVSQEHTAPGKDDMTR